MKQYKLNIAKFEKIQYMSLKFPKMLIKISISLSK